MAEPLLAGRTLGLLFEKPSLLTRVSFEAAIAQLGGDLRQHVVVVDHREPADALDPGVHDQMGGGFASFRVGVVDMVVEGDLVPLLRHFQEMVTP